MSSAYAIRVGGHLDDHWSGSLAGLTIRRNEDGTSTLAGAICDQAQLHGVLAGLRDIGATLLDMHSDEVAPALDRPLLTARLTLRQAVAADAAATWAYRRLDSVNEWLTGTPSDLDAFRDFFAEPARLARTIVIELGHGPEPVVVGELMLRRDDAWAQLERTDEARGTQAELGWVLDPSHSGHGYASEAVGELVRYAFEDLALRRVVATAFLANDASVRLMERVGMRRELHAVRDSLHRSGRWLDSVGYALLDDEWRAGRGSAGSVGASG